jgi:hypothetical protein
VTPPEAGTTSKGNAAPAPADAGGLRDITGIEQVPATQSSSPAPLVGGAVLLVIMVMAVIWAGVRWRRGTKSKQSAEQRALQELARLEAAGPASSTEESLVRLQRVSEVVREYVHARFEVPAPQRTTEEALQLMPQAMLAHPAWRELLQTVLARCDLAKFGHQALPATELLATLQLVREFVQQTSSAAPLDQK